MEKALVSVIMPVYRAEKYIAEAVESVLNQTYPYFEFIIVDDCGMDGSMDIVRQYRDQRVKVLKNDRNRGIAYSRNRALQESRGKYIAIMDDDDVSLAQRFEKQVSYLEEHREIDVLGGAVEAIDAEGKRIREVSEPLKNPLYIKVHFLFRCIFHNSEMMFRKSLIERNCISYCDNCYGMEDFRFWIECSKVGKMTNLSEIIAKHRYHEGTETFRVKQEEYDKRKEYYKELQKLSFSLSNFELSEEDYFIITNCFAEGRATFTTKDEALQAIRVMKRVLNQAKEKNMDFQEELFIFLKKQIPGFYEAYQSDREI